VSGSDLAPFPTAWRTATVVVAHPDDIEWGIAGAVAAWTAAGHAVSYVLVTSGEAGIDGLAPEEAGPAREAEERASGAIVGVSDIEFLGHPDGRVEESLALRRDLAAAIRRQRPDVVVAQHWGERWGIEPGAPWNFADHRAVGRATVDAVGDAGNRWIFRDLEEPPWSGVQWIAVAADPTRATHAVDVSAIGDADIRSLAAHEQYLRALGVDDPVAYATELLRGRGGDGRIPFELLRGPAAPEP
jgi:LmbE family N-acetylglucosaminyl deacetylase